MDRTMNRPEIVLLGAGNVATHLARALAPVCNISQIYNHRIGGAQALAASVGAQAIDTLDSLRRDADLYIISVKDDAIAPLAEALGKRDGVWVHTSGTVGAETLRTVTDRYGVLYPMQTFSRDIDVDMKKVPVFIEAADPATLEAIRRVALLISDNVSELDSESRRKLHIAAVFACNFTNYLWHHSVNILKEIGLDFSAMGPLVEATLAKALSTGPEKGQTGPARRNDTATIAKHLELLDGEAHKLYADLSQYITSHYNDEQNQL